nr:MAG TPA: hypothetical protein [Caudoviricetes sp.]
MSKERSFQEVVEHMLYMINFGTTAQNLPSDLIAEFKSRIASEINTIQKPDIKNEAVRLYQKLGN